ncbi:hypothetical protein AB1K89_13245 [Sporosarcina sp. 179-K 8C2 HS]|uniref:hypothetical protein n=1 Tax=Sporosarcina sp. 179-K 8C2 HS TaxID=3142387 RepID=UPI0039A1F354
MRSKLKIGVIFTVFLTFFLFDYSKLAIANVSEIEYESPSFVDTEYDGEGNNDSEDTGDSRSWFEKLLDDVRGWGGDARDYVLDQWGEFQDWSSDRWGEFTDWAGNAWDTSTEWLGDRLTDIGDFFVWVWEHEWVQVVVGAVISTGVILGGLFLFGTPIGWGIVAVVAAGSLIGGGIYWLMSGDNFNFWGSLASSFGGGLLGLGIYGGVVSGLFATAWRFAGGIVSKAVVASRAFIADAIVKARLYGPIIATKFRTVVASIGSSIKAVVGAIGRGLSRAGTFISTKLASVPWKTFLTKAAWGAGGGVVFNTFNYLAGTPVDEIVWRELFIEVTVGAVSGAILSPFLAVQNITKWGVGFITAYAGFENFWIEGWKNGEWKWENILTGAAAAAVLGFATKYVDIGKYYGRLKDAIIGRNAPLELVDEVIIDNITNPIEDRIKSELDKLVDMDKEPNLSDSQPDPEPDPKPEPQPDPKPDPKPEPQPDPKPEPQPDPKPEPQPDPKPEPKPEPQPDPKPEPKPEPQPDPKPEPNPGSDSKTGSEPIPDSSNGSDSVNDSEVHDKKSKHQPRQKSGRIIHNEPNPSFFDI